MVCLYTIEARSKPFKNMEILIVTCLISFRVYQCRGSSCSSSLAVQTVSNREIHLLPCYVYRYHTRSATFMTNNRVNYRIKLHKRRNSNLFIKFIVIQVRSSRVCNTISIVFICTRIVEKSVTEIYISKIQPILAR